MRYLHLVTVEFLHRAGIVEAVGTSEVKREEEVPVPADFPFVFGGGKQNILKRKPTINEVQEVKDGCENYSN